jgi:hypothetical protein|tara:strand:+ start:35 stop:661 length:627 start_codon:yes stop_codon:yes gene_type:complete
MNIKIIDNFLNKEDFQELCALKLKKISDNEIAVYHNSIDKNNKVDSECLGHDVVRRLYKNNHQRAINLLNELNPKKVDLYEYSEFHIIEIGRNYKFPIHDDTPNKLLSGVIYLRPEKNLGTIFYKNKNGEDRNETEWKQNRAVFFSRSERETWHSYEADGKQNRIALVYNLMTNKIKKVCEIENKSYLFVKIRYLINPYLLRFLKFTI